ncbi:MAG: hypothetical protein FD183_382 [Chitinophagaceae bacterium]|nr:MAG: hypothetical protein FD183_382 [Chitinophagaceae bacterium]
MKLGLYKISILFILLLLNFSSRADWPVGKGRTNIIASYNYFYSSKFFDANGKLTSFNQGDKFQSHFYGLTFLRGLTRRLDFVANVPYVSQDLISNGVSLKNAATGDVTVGFAYHFPSAEYQKHLTIKVSAIIPTYQNIKTPDIGYASKGITVGMNYSFTPIKNAFAVVEGTYTRFIDLAEGPNQYRAGVTFGKSINKYSMVTFNFAHQISQSINTAFNPNPQANKSFTSGLFTLAYGRKLTRTITPYIQGAYTLYGTNIGLGLSASAFIIWKLP